LFKNPRAKYSLAGFHQINGLVLRRAVFFRLSEKVSKYVSSKQGAGQIDKNLAELRRAIREAAIRTELTVSTTTPERTSPFVAMTLSDEEREIIRKFFGVKKKDDAVGLEAKVGEIAPETAPLYPVPSLLYEEIPKLKSPSGKFGFIARHLRQVA
jgi:hypothetical protein